MIALAVVCRALKHHYHDNPVLHRARFVASLPTGSACGPVRLITPPGPTRTMTAQKDLFRSESDATNAPVPTPVVRGPRLTPLQQGFNRLIAKIETMTRTLADRRQLADAHRLRHAARIEPLRRQERGLNRDMVFFLHGRLQREGWTRPQQRTMKEILCTLAQPFILEGDPEMLALHDQHSDESFAEQHEAALAAVSAMVEDVLGVSLDSTGGFGSMEQMLHAGLRQAQDKTRAEAQQRAGMARRKPGTRQYKAEQAQQEAQTTLREVYRKLASALHPDREPDSGERERKTALMSEVNTAYERRDLLALLQLQLRIEQIDPQAIGQLSTKKLNAMMVVLKEQAKCLERELLQADERIRTEFELPWGVVVSAAALSRHLNVLERTYHSGISAMQNDLRRIADDRLFKRWLKEQLKAMDDLDLPGLMDLGIFHGPLSGRR
jgi:hypothetical protein